MIRNSNMPVWFVSAHHDKVDFELGVELNIVKLARLEYILVK